MVTSSMIGFGSLARESSLSLGVSVTSTVSIWGLPGQVAMAEMFALGAPFLAIVIASSMANLRFLPMALSMLPLLRADKRAWRWRYLLVQIMSINIWAVFTARAPALPPVERFPFYLGIAVVCMVAGISGTAVGFILAGSLPTTVTVSLVFLNPAYFVFIFSSVRQRNCIIAVIIGAALGPYLHTLIPNWSVPLCGLIAGTAAFGLDRWFGGRRGNT